MSEQRPDVTRAIIAFLEARRDGNYFEMGRQVAKADIARQNAGEVVVWGASRYARRLAACEAAERPDLVRWIPGSDDA